MIKKTGCGEPVFLRLFGKAVFIMRIDTFINPIQIEKALLGFTGWPDAGKVIQQSFAEIKKALPSEQIAVWNLEGFWHTDSSRPLVFVRHGRIRRLDWPEYHFFLVRLPSSEDILLGLGPEPTTNWGAFSSELVTLIKSWGCKELYMLGSVYDQVFHDEVLISGLVHDSRGINQVRDLGLEQVEYAGPAAVHSVIMEAARRAAIHSVGLWVHYPSYLSAPHELLIASLLKKLGLLLDFEIDTGSLMRDWKKREKEIEHRIEHDHELRDDLQSVVREKAPANASSLTRGKILRMDEFVKRHPRVQEEQEHGS